MPAEDFYLFKRKVWRNAVFNPKQEDHTLNLPSKGLKKDIEALNYDEATETLQNIPKEVLTNLHNSMSEEDWRHTTPAMWDSLRATKSRDEFKKFKRNVFGKKSKRKQHRNRKLQQRSQNSFEFILSNPENPFLEG